VGSALTGDQHPPRGGSGSSPLVWAADGKSVVSAMTARGRSNLIRFDLASGHTDSLTTGDHDVIAYSATPDAQHFALTISDGTHIGDLYTMDAASRTLRQLTHVNDSLWSTLRLSQPERLSYRSFDGTMIEGWVYKPPDFAAGTKYPLILDIHGGPHAAYGDTFFHEAEVMAARGYVVFDPNPRGSTSYGEHFGNVIQYHYPGDDYRDLMIGVDTLVGRGYVDPQRLGVTGGSGGGLLTNWIVGHTHRFAAAVSMRSIADWAHADRGRGRQPHAVGRRRHDDVPRAQGAPQDDGHGVLPRRDARALTLRQAPPPRRAPGPHPELVRQISSE